MFSKRKSSTDHLPGLDEPALRPHARVRQTSPRRSSFHGSDSQPQDDYYHQHQSIQDRKKKYATAPLTHHYHHHAADPCQREKPATPAKSKNLPQAPYQKTFIAMLKGKDSRANKRRSQEIPPELPSPVAQPSPLAKPPTLPPKPTMGTFYQPLPAAPPAVASRVYHAGLVHHNEQLYNAEPLAPVQPELARLSPHRQL